MGGGAAHNYHGAVADEIEGVLTVYEDGHVERAPVMASVAPSAPRGLGDAAWRDVTLCPVRGLRARLFLPDRAATPNPNPNPPTVVYFHGGGFCVGSAAWRCYHDFAARLAASAGCAVISVEYRLAPEHPLPAAYDDGLTAVKSLRELAPRCVDPSRVVLCGDSAGGAIAHHVAARLCRRRAEAPDWLRGTVLIQPFFGGESRTASEKDPPPSSVLSPERSDGYWRLALPRGCDRDHPWCNPVAGRGSRPGLSDERARLPPTLVCAAEADMLRDRNADFCGALRTAGTCVEYRVYGGVGHAFQVLGKSPASKLRTREMLMHVKDFIRERTNLN